MRGSSLIYSQKQGSRWGMETQEKVLRQEAPGTWYILRGWGLSGIRLGRGRQRAGAKGFSEAAGKVRRMVGAGEGVSSRSFLSSDPHQAVTSQYPSTHSDFSPRAPRGGESLLSAHPAPPTSESASPSGEAHAFHLTSWASSDRLRPFFLYILFESLPRKLLQAVITAHTERKESNKCSEIPAAGPQLASCAQSFAILSAKWTPRGALTQRQMREPKQD